MPDGSIQLHATVCHSLGIVSPVFATNYRVIFPNKKFSGQAGICFCGKEL